MVLVANTRKKRRWDVVLRFLALALSLAAAAVLGVDKQTKMVALTLDPTLPPVNVQATAKWRYLSAFVFFMVANAIACAHATISLILTLANDGGKKRIAVTIVLFDLVMVVLLFSSVGAALAVSLVAFNGNSHLRWNKICNVFDKFCDQVAAAIGLSLAASLVFFALVALASRHRQPAQETPE